MSLLVFLIFGFFVGLIARALMPGRQSMGLLMTTLLGVVGSFIGGFLGNLISGERLLELHTAGIIGSVIGAIILLALTGAGKRRVSV
jgi:uncharacterized membrane protein YeaQ/YmgE (transglycosylase-associated protein family)